MCEDTTLQLHTFTLHFYPDESILIDDTQICYSSYPSSFRFKLDPSLTWTFIGSGPQLIGFHAFFS